MKIGMLWFDNDPKKDVTEKIEGAAQYYEIKYGKRPTQCYIHPSMGEEFRLDGIDVKTSRSVLPNHLWLGVE